MYCSTCGALIPGGRAECGTCGTLISSSRDLLPFPAPGGSGETFGRFPDVGGIAICPRCDYQGEGLPYFTRGPHMAALVGATLFTLPYALGAGGFVYYGLRRDHRICPRCGHGWGKSGEGALKMGEAPPRPARAGRAAAPTDGIKRAWSVILFVLGAIMLAVGAVEFELILFICGILAVAGGVVLHIAANQAREERRAALVSSLQTPVLRLAAERNGVLTVTDVAASLGWSLQRAEKILQSLEDGWRVSSEVTDEGVIVFEFRELLLGPGRAPERES